MGIVMTALEQLVFVQKYEVIQPFAIFQEDGKKWSNTASIAVKMAQLSKSTPNQNLPTNTLWNQ